MIATRETPCAPAAGITLAKRLHATSHRSPLRRHATELGLRDEWDLLAVAVQRGCRHYAGVAPERAVVDPGEQQLAHEDLVVLLLMGENRFEPFLIRAAAELLRVVPINVARLAWLAGRERCAPALAHIARAGERHDPSAGEFWRELLIKLGDMPPIAPGVLPHWSRFAVMRGVVRGGGELGSRWVGAAP